ncbi:kinase-like protein [Rhizophagus irregularis]|nr:kinase-like protein [Rhizophagus irregularis]
MFVLCKLLSQFEDHYLNRLNRLLEEKIIDQYYSHDNFNIIGSGGSVYIAKWKNTLTKCAIKKFVDDKEICLTYMANSHDNIIQFRGVMKLEDEKKYSLVLEYANGGTLREHLRNKTITFKWEDQLRFAKELASAALWLHDYKEIIHGDLHPDNILVHRDTIKLADFGRSFEKGKDCTTTKIWGVIPYVDSKMLEMLIQNAPCVLTEKSDIYSLGVIFWELTSRKSPFSFNNQKCDYSLINIISKGAREEPVKDTNNKFVVLYEKCWQHEPNNRPDISE